MHVAVAAEVAVKGVRTRCERGGTTDKMRNKMMNKMRSRGVLCVSALYDSSASVSVGVCLNHCGAQWLAAHCLPGV